MSAAWPWPNLNQSAWIWDGHGSNHSQSLIDGNFAALWSTDFKFLALKDLYLFITVSKVQEANRILRVDFAISRWPHLHDLLSNLAPLKVKLEFFYFLCSWIFLPLPNGIEWGADQMVHLTWYKEK